MSEKKKMLSKQYYNSWDAELVQEREGLRPSYFSLMH